MLLSCAGRFGGRGQPEIVIKVLFAVEVILGDVAVPGLSFFVDVQVRGRV